MSGDKPETETVKLYEPGILKNASDEFIYFSGRTSDVLRPIMLTAVGVIWFFAAGGLHGDRTAPEILAQLKTSTALSWSLGLAVAAVILDIVQYAVATLLWGLYRWTLQEILVNDKVGSPAKMSCMAWAIGRLIGVPRALAKSTGIPYPTSKGSWPKNRDEMRAQLIRCRTELSFTKDKETLPRRDSSKIIWSGLQKPSSHASLNMFVLILFGLKLAFTVASYSCLLAYIL